MVLGLKPMGWLLLGKSKYEIEPRSCMVFELKPMGKLGTSREIEVLDRTKVLHGPQIQTYGETSYFQQELNWQEESKCQADPWTTFFEEISKIKHLCKLQI